MIAEKMVEIWAIYRLGIDLRRKLIENWIYFSFNFLIWKKFWNLWIDGGDSFFLRGVNV